MVESMLNPQSTPSGNSEVKLSIQFFVGPDKFDEDFACPLCLTEQTKYVVNDPVECSECNTIYCMACLGLDFGTEFYCPI